MKPGRNGTAEAGNDLGLETRREVDRFNARMRHFQAVAASVMEEANALWSELWDDLQDPRTVEEILDGVPVSEGAFPAGGWPEFKEKLRLLGHYLDYTLRLCDGSLLKDLPEEKEVK